MINVVGAVMVKGDKVYIFKRADCLRSMPGYFEFPGGKVEQYEMFKYALKRELSEELKINVDINNIHEFPNNVFKNEKLFLKLYIINEWTNDITIDPEIHSEYKIINKNELMNINNLLETDKTLIPSILDTI